MKMSQNTPDKDEQTSSTKKNISLPISRVRLIMKSSPDVSSINQDALFLTTKATELFVQHLALSSFNNGSGRKPTVCRTATWRPPRRRPRPSTSSQVRRTPAGTDSKLNCCSSSETK
uniref:Chromatin accessibility complex protein 1 n=1 Tax=Amphiprion ocellaris TaxID=80972 RepID=A0AAQ6A710_AMPOC